jgi:hypothetical protein
MANVATTFKRLFVRIALKSAQEAGDTLLSVLMASAQSRIDATQSGKVLVASSVNGHSHTWQIPSDFSPQDAAEMVSEILDRYDEAKAKLVADGTTSPTDQQIYDELMDKLQPVKSISPDFSFGRWDCDVITT